MIATHLKLALRRLGREPGTSLLSVLSLAFGIACALMVLVIRDYETSRDGFHSKADRISWLYRTDRAAEDEWARQSASFGRNFALALEQGLGDRAQVTRFRLKSSERFEFNGHESKELAGYVDPQFLEMFDFSVLAGDRQTLTKPHHVLLTRSYAARLSGDAEITDLLGKSISIVRRQSREDFVIAGILEDPGSMSSIQYRVLLPFDALPENKDEDISREFESMVFVDAIGGQDLTSDLNAIAASHYEKTIANYRGQGRWSKGESPIRIHVEPLASLSQTDMAGIWTMYIPTQFIILFSVVGFLVLFIGCANFAVLTVGRSVTRSREVGIRKVSGASRSGIVFQATTESALLCLIGLLIGAGLNEILLPELTSFFPYPVYEPAFPTSASGILITVGLPLGLAVLAGLLPALSLSKLQPIGALRREAQLGGRGRLTRLLVVLQFAGAMFLLTSTNVILEQIDYGARADRGFNTQRLLVIEPKSREDVASAFDRFATAVGQLPEVIGVAAASGTPGMTATITKQPELGITMFHYGVSGDFIRALGVRVIEGKDLYAGQPHNGVLVNQQLLDKLEIENPIGQSFPFKVGGIEDPIIIGVIEDFHFTGGIPSIAPLVVHTDPSVTRRILLVRLRPGTSPKTFNTIGNLWSEAAANTDYELATLEESLEKEAEGGGIIKMLKAIGTTSSSIGILVSCVGLLGLAIQSLARRRRDVGVRKVLGASTSSIFRLLSSRFLLLTILGCATGGGLSFLVAPLFLQIMPFRMPLGPQHILPPALGILLLAIVTIAWHTIATARIDPASELRRE